MKELKDTTVLLSSVNRDCLQAPEQSGHASFNCKKKTLLGAKSAVIGAILSFTLRDT